MVTARSASQRGGGQAVARPGRPRRRRGATRRAPRGGVPPSARRCARRRVRVADAAPEHDEPRGRRVSGLSSTAMTSARPTWPIALPSSTTAKGAVRRLDLARRSRRPSPAPRPCRPVGRAVERAHDGAGGEDARARRVAGEVGDVGVGRARGSAPRRCRSARSARRA